MKKHKTKALLLLIIIIILGLSYIYFFSKPQKRLGLLQIVPETSVMIFQTNHPVESWRHISNTKIWQEFIRTKDFESYQEIDSLLNQYLLNDQFAGKLLKNRPFLISVHPDFRNDFQLLYAIDLQKSSSVKNLTEWILKSLAENFKIKKIQANQHTIYTIQNESTFYFVFSENLLLASQNKKLLIRALERPKQTYQNYLKNFKQIDENLSDGLIKWWINYKHLPEFAGIFFEDARKNLKPLTQQFVLTGLSLENRNKIIEASGITLTDSVPSYFNALLDVKPGKPSAYQILPERTAFYFSLTFKNFNLFKQSQEEFLKRKNPDEFKQYKNQIKKLEKFLKIDLEENFYNWIGREIMLVKTVSNNKISQAVLLIQANDIDKAKSGMEKISRQIRKKTPFKFKSYQYKDFEINYLKQKNFFKLFLGDWFKNIDSPYYTILKDFVVFSNSEKELHAFIDDYLEEKRLVKNQNFENLQKELYSKSHINLYINMPNLMPVLYQITTPGTRKTLNERSGFILSMRQMAFQLQGDGKAYNTKVIIDQNISD